MFTYLEDRFETAK